MKALLRRILLILALAYPIALLAVIAGLRFIGEQWWLTTAALYLPRLVFALPLPALVLALAWFGPRRALWAQLAAALLLLFPLMGLRVSATRTITPGAFHAIDRLAQAPRNRSARLISHACDARFQQSAYAAR